MVGPLRFGVLRVDDEILQRVCEPCGISFEMCGVSSVKKSLEFGMAHKVGAMCEAGKGCLP